MWFKEIFLSWYVMQFSATFILNNAIALLPAYLIQTRRRLFVYIKHSTQPVAR